jgi:hypothetical protein
VVGVRLGFLAAALLAPPALAQTPFVIPAGWERPAVSDLGPNSYDFKLRKGPDLELVARGDFDGDGKADQAELLVNRKAGVFSLFIHLATEAAPRELPEGKLTGIGGTGIRTLKPGTYDTICGRHVPIGPDCPAAKVTTKTDSVGIAHFEASYHFQMWKDGKFEDIWTSD